jgi:hypothetical protein
MLVNPEVAHLPVWDIETGQSVPIPPWFVFETVGDGSYSDGMFRSDNGGVDWQRITWTGMPTDLIQDVERSDLTKTVMFLGTIGQGIFRIDHNGVTQGSLNTGLPSLTVYRMAYDPWIDTLALYGCTEGGLYLCFLLEPTGVPGPEVPGAVVCRASPNPWRRGVRFNVTGATRAGPARVEVFDLSGREVWSWKGTLGTEKALEWNGRDAQGRPVASGVYFYRVELGEETFEGKVVRLR